MNKSANLKCLFCHNEFTQKLTPGRGRKYCSATCRYRASDLLKQPKYSRSCQHCNSRFLAKHAHAKFCSVSCGRAGRRTLKGTKRLCLGCGDGFEPHSKGSKFCSIPCRALLAQIDESTYYLNKRDRERHYSRLRRRLLRGARTSQTVRRYEIYQRDGWICQICFGKVISGTHWNDPKSATLDHIVPLSRGGRHEPLNVRLAHMGCNSRKGNRCPEVQRPNQVLLEKSTEVNYATADNHNPESLSRLHPHG